MQYVGNKICGINVYQCKIILFLQTYDEKVCIVLSKYYTQNISALYMPLKIIFNI